MKPFEKLTDLFNSINLNNLYETLINFNISLSIFTCIIFLLMLLSMGIIAIIYLTIFNIIEHTVLNDKICTTLNTILSICVVIILILNGVFMVNKIPEYRNYLKNQLNKTSYTVTKLSYNKKTALTPKNKQIKIQNNKIKTVKEPTKDKNKVGKIYYTVDVYKPDNIKKLLKNDDTKYQNQLVKHVYIKKYQDLPTITQ